MTEPTYDILGIGNAIVDVVAAAEDQFLSRHDMHKGAMALVDATAGRPDLPAMPPGAGEQRRVGREHLRCRVGAGRARGLYRQGCRRPVGACVPPRHQRGRGAFPHRTAGRRRPHRALPDSGDAGRAADDEHVPRRLRDAGPIGRAPASGRRLPRSPTWRATCSIRRLHRPRSTRRPTRPTPRGGRWRCHCPTRSASTAIVRRSGSWSPVTSISCSPMRLRSPASTSRIRSRRRPKWRAPTWQSVGADPQRGRQRDPARCGRR